MCVASCSSELVVYKQPRLICKEIRPDLLENAITGRAKATSLKVGVVKIAGSQWIGFLVRRIPSASIPWHVPHPWHVLDVEKR